MDELRTQAAQEIKENFSTDDVRAYLNRDDPRHKEIVDQATAIVESVFNEPAGPGSVLTPAEDELRQTMFDDPRTVRQQLEDIFNPKSEAGRAYLDSNHPRHAETVQKAQILMEAKFGEEPKKDPDSRWPIHYRTSGQNVHQEGAFPVEHED
jgi:hypothetical protein